MEGKIKIKGIDISTHMNSIWTLLNDKDKLYLKECTTIKSYNKKEVIIKEGENPQNVMCLISGKAKISKVGASGKKQIINMIKPKEFFGYRAAIAEEKYKANIIAFENSTICVIPKNVFIYLVKNNNKVATLFLKKLACDLSMATQRIVDLTQKHIRGRLADAIILLKDNYGMEKDECTLNTYISREDLASLSNMTTSNAIRTLSDFSAENIVETNGKKIKIIDEEKLITASNIG